jgi:hypothetical protein
MSLLDTLKGKTESVIDLEPGPEPGSRPRFRMSHSSNDLLHRCERKYQLACCMPGDEDRIGMYADLPFGAAVGTGFQTYVKTSDLDQALFATLLAYHPLVEDDTSKQNRKFLERAFLAVESLALKWDECPYELLYIGERPAIEMGFKIILNDYGDYFCGFMDIGVWNRVKAQAGVVEVKTTGINREDITPLYKYSPQALGYSCMLDTALPSQANNFETIYAVSHLHRGEIWPESRIIPFQKTKLDRLNWIMMLTMDLNKAIWCYENNFWPQRWQECLAYNRVCQYFDTCNMASWNQEQEDLKEEFGMPYNEGTDWEFEFTLSQVYEAAV